MEQPMTANKVTSANGRPTDQAGQRNRARRLTVRDSDSSDGRYRPSLSLAQSRLHVRDLHGVASN